MLIQQSVTLASTAEELFSQGNYQASGLIYQELIEAYPESRPYYWKLGLAFLFQGQEADAQMCWMSALFNGTEDEVKLWTEELASLLEAEACRQQKLDKVQNSWLVRQHLREVQPENTNNLLALIHLSIFLNYSISELLSGEKGLFELLERPQKSEFDFTFLFTTLSLILRNSPINEEILTLVEICLGHAKRLHDVRDRLVPICIEFERQYRFQDAILLGEQYLSTDPNDLEFLAHLPGWYSKNKELPKALQTATKRIELCQNNAIEEIFSRHLLIKLLLGTGGHWLEASREIEINRSTLLEIESFEPEPEIFQVLRLVSTSFFSPYISDTPIHSRQLINHVARLFSNEVRKITPPELKEKRIQRREIEKKSFPENSAPRKLKIGYLSYCLKRHSVGWIARWLIQNHNNELFETYGYLLNFDEQDPFQNWYAKQFDQACRVGIDCPDTGVDIAQKISADEVDILVDLDSITLDFSCEVMVHKPAPIQVTWLGWDASGIPEIDYYIADNYVLPKDAEEYYREKLWRLPETYIAVDGFEVEVPKLSRESLDIPAEAVIFLTAQGGYKRNPEAIRLQLSVIKGVPNSYLLIKGFSSSEALQKIFYQLAEEVGIDKQRLIFLPMVASEEVHRANLRIADIVLDTYPYNGATTTLETLWMEIPLVTLVGKQFSARNSYTMLKNVGIEEGIAWTPEEYVEWGIKFGLDSDLRKEVVWKLRESKKSAPLWNVKQFTQNMEEAYQQMWLNYISSS